MANNSCERFVECFTQWDWDVRDLYWWVSDTVLYHLTSHGPLGWLILAVVVLVLLLNLDLTKHTTELVLSSLVRTLITTIVFVFVTMVGAALINAKNQFIARGRTILRYLRNLIPS